MESFLPWCKKSVISICVYSKAYEHTERQTDRHDTFYTPVWSSVSLIPINSWCRVLLGGNGTSTDSAVQKCTPWSLLCFKFLLLACKISLGVNVIGASHMYHIYWYPYLHHHLIQISAQNTASVLHVMLDELWPSISLLHLLLFICSPSRVTSKELYQW